MFSPCPFAPENLVSGDRFGRPVPRQPSHSPHQAESDWLVLTKGISPAFRGGVVPVCVCVCVCCPIIYSGHRFVGVPAGVAQEEDHTGFLHLLSFAVCLP